MSGITEDERHALCEAKVTIDGRPAKVTGARLDFARVYDLESGLSCEWAWPTVAYVVKHKGGAFKL